MTIKKLLESYSSPKISEQTKVREILQQTALLGLERRGFFEKAAFYGGTALRILYGLDRFSEDLDFVLLKKDPQFDFLPYLSGMKEELLSFGFDMEVTQKTKSVETSVVSAFMKIDTIQLLLSIGEEEKSKKANHNEKIKIKLEIDTNSAPGFQVQNRLVLNPIAFYALTLRLEDLFAGKMHALLFRAWKNRVKGRDWYDLIWYIKNGVKLNLNYLESSIWQTEPSLVQKPFNRDVLRNMLMQKIHIIDWKAAKQDVRPFIANPETLEIWSPQFFLELIQKLEVEKG